MRRFFGLDNGKSSPRPPRPRPSLRTTISTFLHPSSGFQAPTRSAINTWAPVNTLTNQNDVQILISRIRTAAASTSETGDRELVLELCDRASSEETARETVRALKHEFESGTTAAQLNAARLWAILLRNSSSVFQQHSVAEDFLAALERLMISPETSHLVHQRVLRVLGDAVFNYPDCWPFRRLWRMVKGADQPDDGALYNAYDDVLRPSIIIDAPSNQGTTILDDISLRSPIHSFPDERFPPPERMRAVGRPDSDQPPPYLHAVGGARTGDANATRASPSLRPQDEQRGSEAPDIHYRRGKRAEGLPSISSASDDPWMTVGPSTSPVPASPSTYRMGLPHQPIPASSSSSTPDPPPPSREMIVYPGKVTRNGTLDGPRHRKLPLVPAVNVMFRGNNIHTPPNSPSPMSQSSGEQSPEKAVRGSSERKICSATLLYLVDRAYNMDNSNTLNQLGKLSQEMALLTPKAALAHAVKYRDLLAQIASDMGLAGTEDLTRASKEDEETLAKILVKVLNSTTDVQSILHLNGAAAQSVLDIIQHISDHELIRTRRDVSLRARKLVIKLARSCDMLPTSLMISGVSQRRVQASFCGGFGDVYQAMYRGELVALKQMRVFQNSDQREVRRKFCLEAMVWQRLRHPCIVPLIGIDTESFPSMLCMISPWMKNGTVLTYLSSVPVASRAALVEKFIREIAEGLAFLHDQNVIHGDLRGSNILVNDEGHACLTDFGLTVLPDCTISQTHNGAGSVRWMAPETHNPTDCGLPPSGLTRLPASDIYSFACLCLELYTGYPPFHNELMRDGGVILRVLGGERPRRPCGGDVDIPDWMWGIMQQCWQHDYADRPSILWILLQLAPHQSSAIFI
ncbi:unnamed protein product [Mycena citricolor]|uniref:Non-specific serine/threonine protein kinase n=1 Tax=Mycena citricolor TaxID=2018698 RepID=A0AAD2H9C2_9AGAR|nr:unnamed protein product [Mycena citricolor]